MGAIFKATNIHKKMTRCTHQLTFILMVDYS